MFVSNVSVYLIAIIYSHWIQTLVDYTQKYYQEMVEYDIRRKELEEDAQDYAEANGIRSKDYVKRYVSKKLNHYMPMVDVINSRMMRFNPAYFEITEIFDHLTDKFDLFVITGCLHFVGVKNAGVSGESNAYVEVMRAV